ncbi:hypothetical protein PBY51_016187 [Eleginops maclovinus]|uniref:Uncharacterized protein n=1 Tax=Eleginops maclovinus TaxID=56733 RepID=A0AAN7XIZ8_ELEMC|nr:hypothetical protein PBY51_016187 [Eleginops maclovinus]
MIPHQQFSHRQPQPSIVSYKVQLTLKLFMLENARSTLEHELFNLTKKVYEEVHGFLNTSFPPSVFSDLTKALDRKCEVIDKFSTLLKSLTVEPQVCGKLYVKHRVKTNQLQPPRQKRTSSTDVPMLQNSLMASSITKAVKVPQATQQLKHVPIPQPAAVQQDDMKHSISKVIMTSSSHLEAEEKVHAVVLDEKRPTDAVSLPPASQRPEINPERPPTLLPPIQALFPEISNPNPIKITPQISWGLEDYVQLQHQKQTSSQLLHFLREKTKKNGALEVTVMGWNKSMWSLSSPERPAIKTQSYQFRQVGTDDLINALAPKTLCTDIENLAPIFRLKRVETCGSLTYTCVIATKTELWDIGEIFTKVGQGDLEAIPLEKIHCPNITPQVENNCLNAQRENQSLQCTDPKHVSHFDGVKTPAMKCIAIPEFQTRKFEETLVVVSHIVSPGNFYIQHAGSIMKLQALVTDSWKASRSYAAQNCIPDIGTQVMGWFPKQEQWCRTRVTKICGCHFFISLAIISAFWFSFMYPTDGGGMETSIMVAVQRLDQGDTACMSLLDIKELTPEMAVLPLQAVQVSLANVTPLNGWDWSEEAVGWFREMVHNRTLYARLYPQGPKVTVELFLEKGKLGAMRRGASLSLRLALKGHANHSKLKDVRLMKRRAFQDKMKKQDSEWEKYLISCYTRILDAQAKPQDGHLWTRRCLRRLHRWLSLVNL